jgi:hypothetical protein
MFPLEKAIIFAPGNASKSRSVAADVRSGRMMHGFYQFGILRAVARYLYRIRCPHGRAFSAAKLSRFAN